MKKIFYIALIFISILSSGQGTFGVDGNLEPSGNYAIVKIGNIQGGMHIHSDTSDLADNLKINSFVFQTSDNKIYYFLSGNWIEVETSSGSSTIPSYTTISLPNAAANIYTQIIVTDAPGAPTLAYSDGVNWRYSTDATIVEQVNSGQVLLRIEENADGTITIIPVINRPSILTSTPISVGLGSSTLNRTGPTDPNNSIATLHENYAISNGGTFYELASNGYYTNRALPYNTSDAAIRPHENVTSVAAILPSYAFVMFPSNDQADGVNSAQQYYDNIVLIQEEFNKYGIFPLFQDAQPRTAYNATEQTRLVTSANLVKGDVEIQIERVFQTFEALKEPSTTADIATAYNSGDNIHLNDAAHILIHNNIMIPTLESFFQVSNITAVELERSLSATSGFSIIDTDLSESGEAQSRIDGQTYYYRARIRFSDGEYSEYSNTINVTQPVNVQVADQTTQINFTNATSTTTGWNTWNATEAPIGTSITGLLDTDDNNTGISITVQDQAFGTNDVGVTGGGIYPDDIMSTTWRVDGSINTLPRLQISGLSNLHSYNITFIGSDIADPSLGRYITAYVVEEDYAEAINTGNNTGSEVISLNGLNPQSGEINIRFSTPVFGTGFLCGMIIERRDNGADVTGPILTNAIDISTGETTGSGSVSTNEDTGILYFLVSQNSTESINTIKTTGNSQPVSSIGTQNVVLTSLTGSTTYYLHFVHTDGSGNDSNVISGDGFTTDAPDTTPPVLANATDEPSTATVDTDEGDGTLNWVVTQSSVTPSSSQIKNGEDHTGATSDQSGSQSVTSTGTQTVIYSGLTSGVTYYTHFVHTDAEGNESNTISGDGFTPASTPSQKNLIAINTVNSNPRGYIEYLPVNYASRSDWPILIYLHGTGASSTGDGSLGELSGLQDSGVLGFLNSNDRDFIVLGPQDFNGLWGVRCYQFVEWAIAQYGSNINENNVHMIYNSGGGGGFEQWHQDNPASLSLIASHTPAAALTGNGSVAEGIAGANSGGSYWFHHDTGDPQVGIGQTRNYYNFILDAVGSENQLKYRYTEYDRATHGTQSSVYTDSGQGVTQISGTIPGGTYQYYSWTSGSWWDWLLAQERLPPSAPTLSNAVDTEIGSTQADVSVDTDDNSGEIFYVITTSPAAPTSTQIKNGQDHTGTTAIRSGGTTSITVGTNTFNVTGLAASTTYYAHFVHNNAVGDSNTLSGDGFTTDAPDITAPILSSATDVSSGSSTANGTVTTDEGNGTLFFLASTNSSESLATIKAGSSQSVTSTGVQAVSIGGLNPNTSYFIHYAHTDASGNDSNVISGDGFTTALATSAVIMRVNLARGDQPAAGESGWDDFLDSSPSGSITANGYTITVTDDFTTTGSYSTNFTPPTVLGNAPSTVWQGGWADRWNGIFQIDDLDANTTYDIEFFLNCNDAALNVNAGTAIIVNSVQVYNSNGAMPGGANAISHTESGITPQGSGATGGFIVVEIEGSDTSGTYRQGYISGFIVTEN